MAMQTGPGGKVDRQTTTPFHLKLFYRTGSFHSLTDFPTATPTGLPPLPPHLQIYTWPTCTLRELSHLLVTALPTLLPSPAIGTRLAYRLVYPDTHNNSNNNNNATTTTTMAPGRYLSKELGDVVVGDEGAEEGPGRGRREEEREGGGGGGGEGGEKVVREGVMAGRLGGEPDKTLQEARFVIGDFISCAIFPPGADGSVAPGHNSAGRGRGGRGEFGGEGAGSFGGGGGGVRRGGEGGGWRVAAGGVEEGGEGAGGEGGVWEGEGEGGVLIECAGVLCGRVENGVVVQTSRLR
ncbi:hypothetical protein HO173_011060 [Letharia columbiana]|uniref:Sin3-associated polypeptide Sap18 n=1 Tax=Letharia columbiana TaxID=112416 RepID=A0A8H6FLG9_9LECA|nr:uncharacterized protein HO173_011060 [Letharia columbiana]KAF6230708.1 hypothetical protein HO173_011060 [Letharia columbiana]